MVIEDISSYPAWLSRQAPFTLFMTKQLQGAVVLSFYNATAPFFVEHLYELVLTCNHFVN